MYKAKIVTDSGKTVGFGYEYGSVFDISPLSGVNVDVNSSQGFQQIGTTVESLSVGGLSRTIKGVFVNKTNAEAQSLINNLPIFTRGKLYFNDNYYCNIVVSKTPVVATKKGKTTFSLMVYCAEPFWYGIDENVYTLGAWTKKFRFPTSYDQHIYATKDASVFVDCYNYGSVFVPPKFTFKATTTVKNFGIMNAESMQYLKINTALESDESIEVYRENNKLHIERVRNDKRDDIFEYLDEYSDLYWINAGSNILRMIADENVEGLQCTVSFVNAYMGVVDDVS